MEGELNASSAKMHQDMWNQVFSLTSPVNNITLSPEVNGTNIMSLPGNRSKEDCMDNWAATQHGLYQLASLCIAAAFVVPKTLNYNILLLRFFLIVGSFLMLIWGWTKVCEADVLGWYIVLFLGNVAHLAYYLYHNWPTTFHVDIEELYTRVFRPFQWSHSQFRDLICCGTIKELPSGATYAMEGASHIGEKLSILLSGK